MYLVGIKINFKTLIKMKNIFIVIYYIFMLDNYNLSFIKYFNNFNYIINII